MLKYPEMILLLALICLAFYRESKSKIIEPKPTPSFIILNNSDTAWIKINQRSVIDTTYTLKRPE
jgi:hypothetical protein